jgi:predicted nucleic acid-binding protein
MQVSALHSQGVFNKRISKGQGQRRALPSYFIFLVEICQVIPFDIECARVFGTIKSKLQSLGRPTGEMDGLIAATAMAHKATLVTADKKHSKTSKD